MVETMGMLAIFVSMYYALRILKYVIYKFFI